MNSLEGKVIAITGASGGMGVATAHLLASRGASLSLCDIDAKKLESLLSDISEPSAGKLYTSHTVSVTDSAQVDAWIEETVKRHGRLDGAVNLAGVAHDFVSFHEITDNEWNRVMGINCNGTMSAMRAQLRAMKGTGGGAIINTSSCTALTGTPHMGPYVASKHAVIGITKTAAREYGPENIRINVLAPGVIDTPMARTAMEMMGKIEGPSRSILTKAAIDRTGTPEEIAQFVAFLVSDEARFITGAVLSIDGGYAT